MLRHGLSPVRLVEVEVPAVAAEQAEEPAEEEQDAARTRRLLRLRRMQPQIFRLWTRTLRLYRLLHGAVLRAAAVVVAAGVEVAEILRLLLPRDRC